jgi:hypothetical protein
MDIIAICLLTLLGLCVLIGIGLNIAMVIDVARGRD